MLIKSENIKEVIKKIKEELITEYKKKYYNGTFVAEKNLIERIEKELKGLE